MAEEENVEETENGGNHSTALRAAVAMAATGAAAYGVRRLRSSHEDQDSDGDEEAEETDEETEDDEGDEDEESTSGKREEITRALSSRVADAKAGVSKLKPGGGSRQSVIDGAWSAASDQLLPVARDAAASLGTLVAKKAPEVVREELIPPFVEGLQKG